MSVNRRWGIDVIAYCIIATSLAIMFKYVFEKDSYFYLFSTGYMPAWLVSIRYLFSWTLRIIGITCAVGLICRKEIFRQLTVSLAFFCVVTIYWHHPYKGVHNYIYYLMEKSPMMPRLEDPQIIHVIAIISVFVLILSDVTFWILSVKYLTRPDVKAEFKGKSIWDLLAKL